MLEVFGLYVYPLPISIDRPMRSASCSIRKHITNYTYMQKYILSESYALLNASAPSKL